MGAIPQPHGERRADRTDGMEPISLIISVAAFFGAWVFRYVEVTGAKLAEETV